MGMRKAFTLIELLVVVAIIAILAAILFPVFARARENARKSSCQSNMKQLGLGFQQYIQDYDGRYPGVNTDTSQYGFQPYWDLQILPYTKSMNLLQCPSDSESPRVSSPQLGPNLYRSYGATIYGASESIVTRPSETVLLNEDISQGTAWDAFWTNGAFVTCLGSDTRWRHNETANFLYADGHVKALHGVNGGPYPQMSGYTNYTAVCGANTNPPPQ